MKASNTSEKRGRPVLHSTRMSGHRRYDNNSVNSKDFPDTEVLAIFHTGALFLNSHIPVTRGRQCGEDSAVKTDNNN
jgi:hypothetical protein